MMVTVAIIGAGMCGATLSKILNNYANITVFEKSRGVGGRLATRRAEPYVFDHGAQYFTAKTFEFQSFIRPLLKERVIKVWEPIVAEISGNKILRKYSWPEDTPHYVGVSSMNAVAKHFLKDSAVLLNNNIDQVVKKNNQWELYSSGACLGSYDWVISTAPAEQSRCLLGNHIEPGFAFPNMQACYSMMLGYDKKPKVGFDVATIANKDISWISKNHTKPHRPDNFSLLVNSTNTWADKNLEIEPETAINHLYSELSEIIDTKTTMPEHKAIHRWKYANIVRQDGPKYYLTKNENLAMCGDWFIKGTVESAFLSAYHLGHMILETINT